MVFSGVFVLVIVTVNENFDSTDGNFRFRQVVKYYSEIAVAGILHLHD